MKAFIIILTGALSIFFVTILIFVLIGKHVKLFGFEVNDDPKRDTTLHVLKKDIFKTITIHDTIKETAQVRPKLKQYISKSYKNENPNYLKENRKDTAKSVSKYTVNAPTNSAIGDYASVQNNYNGIKQRVADDKLINEIIRTYRYFNRDFEIYRSNDAETNQFSSSIISKLKDRGIKIKHDLIALIPFTSTFNVMGVGIDTTNKKFTLVIGSQENK